MYSSTRLAGRRRTGLALAAVLVALAAAAYLAMGPLGDAVAAAVIPADLGCGPGSAGCGAAGAVDEAARVYGEWLVETAEWAAGEAAARGLG